VRDNRPLDDGSGWYAAADVNPHGGTSDETRHLMVYAICINA
jgi:hypothetical protein